MPSGAEDRIQVELPDPEKLAEAWTRVFANSIDALNASTERGIAKVAPPPFDLTAPVRAFSEFMVGLWSNPAQLLQWQSEAWREWIDLWTSSMAVGKEVTPVGRGDRRFRESTWDQPLFDFLRQAYLLTSRQTLDLVEKAELDPATRVHLGFYAKQFLDALSPANFAFTNPEAIRAAMESGGVSLLAGLANMLSDAASPSGLVSRRSSDDFQIGVNLAATRGSVIAQNELMQLIQYDPSTEKVQNTPLLYVPPLVNKYYLLDLRPQSSMIKWLVDQGHTVFVISWINPDSELADYGIAEYINRGPVEALDIIARVTGERGVDAFGFCMGGTLLAMSAAYLTEIGENDRLNSISMIGSLLDFSNTGEWATFTTDSQLDALEKHVEKTGVIGADKLQALFSLVRANDLIWPSVVNHYLLDRTAPASDLLFWFADGARIPRAFLAEYGRQLLYEDGLKKPGGIVINGVGLDLNKIKTPACVISLKDDHVSAWNATYEGAKLLGGPTNFLLGGSGHNAGLINPPHAGKHGHWVNKDLPNSADEWLANAKKHEGSWWPVWQEWLTLRGKGTVAARTPGSEAFPVIEPAPGSYVQIR